MKTTKLQQAYYNGSNGLVDTPCLLDVEIDFPGLDVARFHDCLKALIQRHPALRSRICDRGLTLEIMDYTQDVNFQVQDLTTLEGVDLESELDKIRQSFGTLQECQWDLRLVRLPGRVRLFLRVGLIALDAGSIYQLAKELDQLYGGHDLPRLPSYDFVDAMQRAATMDSRKEMGSFPEPPRLPRVEHERRGG